MIRFGWVAAILVLLVITIDADPAEAAISSCSVSTSGMSFSPYNPVTRAAVDGVATITVTCSGSGTENLSLNINGGNTGSCTSRQMRNGTASLAYQLYRDAARTADWCDGSSRLDVSLDFSSGSTQTRTFYAYGRIPSGQNSAFGSYSDTLTVVLKKGGGVLATTSMSVTGSVAATCSLSVGTLGFGTYSSAAVSLSTATISVQCSSGAAYRVSLAGGENLNGTNRRMAGPGASYLAYELFSDSARTVPWGDGTSLGDKLDGTGSGALQNLTVYGRVPANQQVSAGNYTDRVVVTVEY